MIFATEPKQVCEPLEPIRFARPRSFLHAALDKALQKIDYAELRKEQAERVPTSTSSMGCKRDGVRFVHARRGVQYLDRDEVTAILDFKTRRH